MRKAVLFDMDGTLLPVDTDWLVEVFLDGVSEYAKDLMAPREVRRLFFESQAAMYEYDGVTTNQQRFRRVFDQLAGDKAHSLVRRCEAFYEDVFPKFGASVKKSREARRAVDVIKAKGYRVVVASNPVFPHNVQVARLHWAGFHESEFELVTSGEIMHYCKPDARYYREIIDGMGLRADECIMVGNDVQDDFGTLELGFAGFYLDTFAINRTGEEPDCPRGGYPAFLKWAETLAAVSKERACSL